MGAKKLGCQAYKNGPAKRYGKWQMIVVFILLVRDLFILDMTHSCVA